MKINIISRDNGVGLSKDIHLLNGLLSEHEVSFCDYGSKPDATKPLADLNIFVELVHAGYFSRARLNTVIPNPEWYDLRWRQFLPRFNAILCKTRSAIEAFKGFNKKCQYISFTSQDRLSSNYKKDENRYLHVAGKSGQKGTETVYKCWAENPDFPHLTVVQNPGKAKPREVLHNVTMINEHIDDETLKELQNTCGVHLCPSETEGFGHYIAEAMSARALVIATDAPPMNELITAERGILCKWENRSKQKFAYNHYVSSLSLADAVRESMILGVSKRDEMRDISRKFYEENDVFFRNSFKEAINQLNHEKYRYNTVLETRRLPLSNTRAHR